MYNIPVTKTLLGQTLVRPLWVLFSARPQPCLTSSSVLPSPVLAIILLNQFREILLLLISNRHGLPSARILLSWFNRNPGISIPLSSPLSNFPFTDSIPLLTSSSATYSNLSLYLKLIPISFSIAILFLNIWITLFFFTMIQNLCTNKFSLHYWQFFS